MYAIYNKAKKHAKLRFFIIDASNVFTLSIQTDSPVETVYTQNRHRCQWAASDLGLHCLSFVQQF